ncbi:glycosyltransferase family 4 protein [bacterium]|nr:glycosyltransferase family 4 protein [bacterium]
MKICLISGSYPNTRCGVGDQVRCLAEKLDIAGESVSVITSCQAEVKASAHIKVYPEIDHWQAPGIKTIVRLLDRIQPEVVNLHYPSAGFEKGLAPNLLFAWLHWRRPQWRRVLTLHEYGTYTTKGRLRLWPAIRFAQRVICTNQWDQSQVQQNHAARTAGIQVIPLGSNVGSLEENPAAGERSFVLPDQQKTWLLHFGTVMPNKGWEIMLPALRRLKNEQQNIGLVVVGALEPQRYAYHKKVHDMIQSLGLSEDIHFTGYLATDHIADVFAKFSLAVQPYTEGVQLNRSSLIALLAYGKAVISTDSMLLLEQLTHGKHFWGVLPNDDKALAEGIKLVLKDPVLIQRLQAGALSAAQYFSWKRIVSLYRGVYQQLLGRV